MGSDRPRNYSGICNHKIVVTSTSGQNHAEYILMAPDIAILCTVRDGSRHRDDNDDGGCCVMTERR
jgi:hypothetical protein